MGSNRTDARLPRISLKPGPWLLADQGSEELGYLVVAGLLLRRVTVAAGRSVELLGPGDLLLPWREESASFSDADWEVAEPTRLEVWDLRPASPLSHSPTFAAEIATRSIDRARALALQSAIMSIVGIEDRLLALFWAFAERWGEMSAGGAEVEVNVPQGVLAEMVGTRRPTANLALGNLRDRGRLVEAAPRRWVLTGPPPPAPAGG